MDFDGEGPKRSTRKAAMDILSSLPVEVIHQIMERLTLRDAAKMSALSSKWRKNWLSFPHIAFDSQFVDDLEKRAKMGRLSDIYSTMDRILLHHKGPIAKFTIGVAYPDMDISPWLSYISEGVREFTAEVISLPLKLPSHLFSCSELRMLHLSGCIINIPPAFTGFSNLLSLKLTEVIASGDVFGSFVHMSSKLEELVLVDYKGFEDVTIDLPLLRNLEIAGDWKSICFKNAPNLTVVALFLDYVEDFNYKKARNLINFLATSCRIEVLHLGAAFHMTFMERHTQEKLHTFDHLTFLGLDDIDFNNSNGLSYVKNMMRCCPKMTHGRLVTDHSLGDVPIVESGHDCVLDNLRRIKIIGFAGLKTELKLLEFLLQNSPKLEALDIRKLTDRQLEWKITKELMRFPRASSKAEILVGDELD